MKKVRTKLDNVCGKCGPYNVPNKLFQKRTKRSSRCLISWKTVLQNKLTLDQLNTFYDGVTVEMINQDFFSEENRKNPLFRELLKRLGSSETVSSMISFRSEYGSSSSRIERESFNKFIKGTKILYRGNEYVVNRQNYKKFYIKRIDSSSEDNICSGNEKIDGFLFVSISGGDQKSIESHKKDEFLFNPACEYANNEVSKHINYVMIYFIFCSVDVSLLDKKILLLYNEKKQLLEKNYIRLNMIMILLPEIYSIIV